MGSGLKPGQIVKHPEHGYGVSVRGTRGSVYIAHGHSGPGFHTWTHYVGDGWEPIETCTTDERRIVSLPCPECGEPITRAAEVWGSVDGRRIISWAESMPLDSDNWHRCTPAEPVRLMHPEPTERGAKATFTFHEGKTLELLRVSAEGVIPWVDQKGRCYAWDELIDMDGDDREGSITLGWGDDE